MRYYIREEDVKDLDLDVDVSLVDRHGNAPEEDGEVLLHFGDGELYICNMSGSGETIWFEKAYRDGNIIRCIYKCNEYFQEMMIGILKKVENKEWKRKTEEE